MFFQFEIVNLFMLTSQISIRISAFSSLINEYVNTNRQLICIWHMGSNCNGYWLWMIINNIFLLILCIQYWIATLFYLRKACLHHCTTTLLPCTSTTNQYFTPLMNVFESEVQDTPISLSPLKPSLQVFFLF